MKLLFACLAISLAVLCSYASAQLTDLSANNVYLQVGKSMIVKVYASNPNATFANITVWLGGTYPQSLANFSSDADIILSPDRRTAVVGLNPKEEKVLSLVISSAAPQAGGYTITLDSNTTVDAVTKDRETMSVSTDFAPSFPGLDFLWVALAFAISGSVYWTIQKKG